MIGKSNPRIRERTPKVEENPPAYNPDTEKPCGNANSDPPRAQDSGGSQLMICFLCPQVVGVNLNQPAKLIFQNHLKVNCGTPHQSPGHLYSTTHIMLRAMQIQVSNHCHHRDCAKRCHRSLFWLVRFSRRTKQHGKAHFGPK